MTEVGPGNSLKAFVDHPTIILNFTETKNYFGDLERTCFTWHINFCVFICPCILYINRSNINMSVVK